MVETTWVKAYSNGMPYYYNSATQVTQWEKPTEILNAEKKIREWENELEKDPVWVKKRDRFGRDSFYNRKTKESQFDKPFHWWTEEEREALRQKEEAKRKAEEDRRRKLEEEREARKKPAIRAKQAELKDLSSRPASEIGKKIAALGPAHPLFLMSTIGDAGVVKYYKERKEDAEYERRRANPTPHPAAENTAVELIHSLFRLSAEWRRGNHTQWPLKPLHIITLYVVDAVFVFDNLVCVPTNPSAPIFDIKGYYGEDMIAADVDFSGYSDRRVSMQVAHNGLKVSQALEVADEKKEPICSDEEWGRWWEKKMQLKEEMYRLLQMRSMGFDESTGTYDYEHIDMEALEAADKAAGLLEED